MRGHRIARAVRLALFVAAAGALTVLANDPPSPGGGGSGTNAAPSTNFVAQPFPLNLIATCLSADAAGNLASWADLDGAVAAGFGLMTNSLMIIYPPGIYSIPVDGGLFTFSTNDEIAANLGLFQPLSFKGFSLWKMGAVETQLTTRSWVYMGASDGANSVAFRTNAVPAGFDPQAWVRSMFGNPPSYLTGSSALAQWYADRDRSRAFLGLTLINANDLAPLQAALQAARANATNATPDPALPTLPADTNRVAFAGIAGMSTDGRLGVWIYSPIDNLPVDVFTSANLATKTPWKLIGTINANSPFTLWYAPPGTSATAFINAARADIDTDGDGIPDDRENLIFGTDPTKWDSDNDNIGDYAEIFTYGTDPNNADTKAPSAVLTSPPNNYQMVWVP